MAGKSGEVFARSGKDADAGKYMTFQCEGRTLDCEFPTAEAAAFIFKKFADLFQAYATAQLEKLKGESVSIRVAAIVDGGASNKAVVVPTPKTVQASARAAAAAAAQNTPGSFRSNAAGGGGGVRHTPQSAAMNQHAFPYHMSSPAPGRQHPQHAGHGFLPPQTPTY